MQNGISVVIPNYNGVQLFPETLSTVFAALKTVSLPNEIIIVDDCSTDDSVRFLQENFPSVKIIANKSNSGFSVAANNGIKTAQYPLVLLLNSDVKLEPDYFQHQLHYFERDDTFGVMGRIAGWNDEHIQDGAKYPSFHNLKIKTSVNYLLKNEDEMKNGLYSMYLSGANALFDKKKFLLLGGFNEMFSPFYVEDTELSLRAWRMGWKCYYDYQSVCRHKTSTTIQSTSKKKYVRTIYNRNKWFLHAIHLDDQKRLLWFCQLIIEVFFQSILLKGYYAKAFLMFIKDREAISEARKKINQLSKGKTLLSVKQVADFIQQSIKNKDTVFFKS